MISEDLAEIRLQINGIDDQIIALLQLRINLVKALKPFKTTLTDQAREDEILSKIESKSIKDIYLAIFEASKRELSCYKESH